MGDVIEFPKTFTPRDRATLGDTLIDHAATVGKYMGDDLAGFFVVAMSKKGTYSCGWRNPPEMSVTLFGALLSEICRRETITQTEAVEVFNNQSGNYTPYDDGA